MKPLLAPLLLVLGLLTLGTAPLHAQAYTFSTLAGKFGHGTADGTGATAQFFFPGGAVLDSTGTNLYVADTYNHCIRKVVVATGEVTTFAGTTGVPGSTDDVGTAASFRYPVGLAVDTNGNLYVADSGNFTIRKIVITSATVSTLSGQTGVSGFSDGSSTTAKFSNVQGVGFSSASNRLYVADRLNHAVREVNVTSGAASLFAGQNGNPGFIGGFRTVALLRKPSGIAVDRNGIIYVADTGNHEVRYIAPDQNLYISAGLFDNPGFANGSWTTARLNEPMLLSKDNKDNIYVADSRNAALRKISSFLNVTTLGQRTLTYPRAVASDTAGNSYVMDTGAHTIRKISTTGVETLVAGRTAASSDNGTGRAAGFNAPESATMAPDGTMYVADTASHTIRKVLPDGTVSLFAGAAGVAGSTNGNAITARFNAPAGIVSDFSGNLYVADTGNHVIRKITFDGSTVTTFAGTVGARALTNGTGAAARFNSPKGLAFDASGNLYVADSANNAIRKITPAGAVSTLAGTLTSGNTDGTGSGARFKTPTDLVLDSAGSIYVTDFGNATVRKVTSGGVVSTFAGTASTTGNTDGTGSAARFGQPAGIAIDPAGNLFVTDTYYQNLRQITPARVVSTVAGQAWMADQAAVLDFMPYGGDTDGADTIATFYEPRDVVFDAAGTMYVVDRLNHTIRKGTPAAVVGQPVITSHPASVNVAVGATPVTFSVAATGVGLTYQWFKNDVAITGETADTYTLPAPATALNEGSYSVAVTSSTPASIRSNAAILHVLIAPTIVTSPTSLTVNQGQPASFTVKTTGLALTYVWKKNGNPTGAPSLPTFTIPSTVGTDTDVYTVEVSNAAGTAISSPFNLTVRVPASITTPVAADIKFIGQSVTLSVVGAGTDIKYQWYKGTSAISSSSNPTAITANLTLTNLKSTDAATYKVVVKNTLAAPSSSATLVIVDPNTYGQDVVNGKDAPMTPRAYGTITGYQWQYNTVDITAPGAPIKYTGFNTKTLTVKAAVDPTDEGLYTCKITSAGGTLTTGPINLRVLVPPFIAPLTAPNFPTSISVSQLVSIPLSFFTTRDPAKYIVTGLPSGLKYNGLTGEIYGRALVDSGTSLPPKFVITVKASNAAGFSNTVSATLNVVKLPTGVLGTYTGYVTRNAVLGANLGGKLTLTVAVNGVVTGSLQLGKTAYKISGAAVNADTGGTLASEVLFDNKTGADLRLSYTINLASRTLSGTVEDGAIASGVFTPGANSTAVSAALPTNTIASYAGNYTLASSHAVAGDDKPQGYSYAAFKVGTTASGTFRLADGTTATFAGPIGQDGTLPVLTLLYGSTGSLHGRLHIDTGASNKLDASLLGWTKNPQTATTRYFKAGFGPLDLTTFGRKYVIPTSGTIPMGLASGAGNAKLVFTDGLAPVARMDVPALEIQAAPGAVVILPPAVTATATLGSHAKMSLKVVPGSGTTFTVGTTAKATGSFTLVDQDPTSVAVKLITRTNAFESIIVDDGVAQKAYGFFLLQELPSIGFTSSTSLYRSGKVVLSAP